MNVKTKTILLSTIIFLSVNVIAQNFRYSPWKKLTIESNSPYYKIPGKLYIFNSTITGSVFLYNDWKNGSIILENGASCDNLRLKLNTFLGELIMYNKQVDAIIIIDKDAVKEFTLVDDNGNTEIFRKVNFDKIPLGNRYLNVLYEGRIKLMLLYITVEQATSSYYDREVLLRNSEFITKKIYYLELPGRGIVSFKPKLRSIIELFPEQKKAIKQLHRKNHLTYNNEPEIIRAIKFIETYILN
jgi:hypothetical protein